MKYIYLLPLLVCFSVAVPQGELRPRLRGSRRFSLASPAVQAHLQDKVDEEVSQISEDDTTKRVDATPRTRTRGATLLRRGRPFLRQRARPATRSEVSPPNILEASITQSVKPVANQKKTSPSGRRGTLRLRRPKRPTTTTTTIASTTTVATESPAAETPEKGEVEKTVDGIKIGQVDLEPEHIPEETPVPELVAEEVSVPEKITEAPRKFRPIPIRIGHRGGHNSFTKKEQDSPTRSEQPTNQSKTEEQRVVKKGHRFSPRNRTPLRPTRVRSRGSSQQSETEVPTASADVVVKPLAESTPVQINSRTRSRVSSLRRPALRTPSRQRFRTKTVEKPAQQMQNEKEPKIEILPLIEESPQLEIPQVSITNLDEEIENETIPIATTVNVDETTEITPTAIKRTTEKIITDVASSITKPTTQTSQRISTTVTRKEENKIPKTVYKVRNSDLNREKNTLIGTVEDVPAEEVRVILSGFGSRRRGFGMRRATIPAKTDAFMESTTTKVEDYLYDYYDYLYENDGNIPQT